MESHWTSRHICCIDNVAIVLPTKVSQFRLACLMEGRRSSSFSLWFSKETCLIEWYQVLRHICWSFIERHPCIATRPSHQTFLPAYMQIMWYWNSTHVCLLPRRRICRHVCLLHYTSNNVCYNCTRLTGMLGNHALDQCACLLYLYQTSNPVIIATGSVDIFTISMFDQAHMSETKTPGQQLYM